MTTTQPGLTYCLVSCLRLANVSSLEIITAEQHHRFSSASPAKGESLLHNTVQAQSADQRNLYSILVDSVTLMCLHIEP